MMLQIPDTHSRNAEQAEQEVRIAALTHLIDENFDAPRSCHAVCMLLSELYADSDDKINQMVADLATKALNSTVEMVAVK